MELYKTVVTVEYSGVKSGFQYSISLSETVPSTRFSLDNTRGCDIGPRDYPPSTDFKNFTLSAASVSFMSSNDTPNLLLRLVVVSDAPVILGMIVLAPETLATISNRSTRSNHWGTTPWILPVDFWESRTIGQMLDLGQSQSVKRDGPAKAISAKSLP